MRRCGLDAFGSGNCLQPPITYSLSLRSKYFFEYPLLQNHQSIQAVRLSWRILTFRTKLLLHLHGEVTYHTTT
jgi:hypothetical protein